jgi:hypothetical protein
MDFEKVNVMYVFRPPTTYQSHNQVLEKCKRLRKQVTGLSANIDHKKSIPQIREFFEEIQTQLDTKGRWWGRHWTCYDVKFEDLECAVSRGDLEIQFFRNLMIIKFSSLVSIPLKQALFYKALESELEVVPE